MKKFTARLLVLAVAVTVSSCGWLGNFTGNNLSTSNQNGTGNGSPNNPFVPPTGTGAQFVIYAPSPASAGICWPATVTTANNGLASNVASTVTANINTPANLVAYSNSSCSNTISSVSIAAGSASASLWLKSNVQGSYTVTATDPAAVFAQGNLSLVVNSGNNPNIPIRMVLSGAPSVKAGACTAYTASLYSTNGSAASFSGNTSLGLSSSSPDAQFFSAAGCSGSGTAAVTMSSGVSSITFYHKNIVAGLVSINATANSIYGDLNVLIVPDVASKAVVQGPSTIMTGGCYAYSVVAKDLYDNPSPVTSNTTSPLSLSGVGGLFSDSGCTAAVNSTVIVAGNASGLFYFRSLGAGSAVVTPNPVGLTGIGLSIAVNQASGNLPAKLAFDGIGSNTSAGSCFGPLYLRVQDMNGNTLPANATANLSTSGNGQFYSDASCMNDIGSVGTGSAFFFRDLKAESLVLNADDAAHSLASASKSMLINHGSLYQLVLLGASNAFNAGDCVQMSVGYADPYLNAVPLPSAHTAILKEYGLANGMFYSDACSNALPVVSGGRGLGFNAGEYQKTVYFKETRAGMGRLEATDGALNPASFNFSVAAGDPKIAKVTRNPGTIIVGECGGPIELTLFDAYDNITTARVAMTFGMASAGGSFFSDASCGNGTTSVLFGPGSSVSQVYFKPSNTGVVTVICTAPPPCGGPTFTIQVNPSGALQRLAVLGVAPRSVRGPAASFAGACMQFQVQGEDMNGNPVARVANISVDLAEVFASNPGLTYVSPKFFASAGCANATTGVSLPAGNAPVSFWYKGTTAGVVDLTASSGALATQPYQVTMNVGPAAGLYFSGPSSSTAGVCTGPFTVSGVDVYGNASPLVNGTSLALSGAGQGGFYAASDCSGSPVSAVQVQSPSIQGSFFFKDNKAENLTLNVASSGLGSANRALNVVAGDGVNISVLGSLTSAATVCSAPIKLQITDAFGNISTSSSVRTFALSQNGTVAFYSDASCASPTSSINIGQGQLTSHSFYFKGVAPQSATMTVASVPAALLGQYMISIGQPPCSGTVVLNDNPFNIAAYVNSKFPGAIREAALFHAGTAQKICEISEHPRLISFASHYGGSGRSGWASPGDNTLSYYNNVSNTWITAGAKYTSPYNVWISSISCGCN